MEKMEEGTRERPCLVSVPGVAVKERAGAHKGYRPKPG